MGRGLLSGSSGVMNCRYLPFARLLTAHLPRIAAPSRRGTHVRASISIEAACRPERPELAAQRRRGAENSGATRFNRRSIVHRPRLVGEIGDEWAVNDVDGRCGGADLAVALRWRRRSATRSVSDRLRRSLKKEVGPPRAFLIVGARPGANQDVVVSEKEPLNR